MPYPTDCCHPYDDETAVSPPTDVCGKVNISLQHLSLRCCSLLANTKIQLLVTPKTCQLCYTAEQPGSQVPNRTTTLLQPDDQNPLWTGYHVVQYTTPGQATSKQLAISKTKQNSTLKLCKPTNKLSVIKHLKHHNTNFDSPRFRYHART